MLWTLLNQGLCGQICPHWISRFDKVTLYIYRIYQVSIKQSAVEALEANLSWLLTSCVHTCLPECLYLFPYHFSPPCGWMCLSHLQSELHCSIFRKSCPSLHRFQKCFLKVQVSENEATGMIFCHRLWSQLSCHRPWVTEELGMVCGPWRARRSGASLAPAPWESPLGPQAAEMPLPLSRLGAWASIGGDSDSGHLTLICWG